MFEGSSDIDHLCDVTTSSHGLTGMHNRWILAIMSTNRNFCTFADPSTKQIITHIFFSFYYELIIR